MHGVSQVAPPTALEWSHIGATNADSSDQPVRAGRLGLAAAGTDLRTGRHMNADLVGPPSLAMRDIDGDSNAVMCAKDSKIAAWF